MSFAARVRRFHWPKVPATASLMGIWFAVALHTIWASELFFSDTPKRVTGVYAISELFPARTGLAIILLIVAGCAIYGVLGRTLNTSSRVLLLVPQQLVLGISAAGAVRAMWLGHFADGIMRPHVFLITDQSPQVLALLVHSATIVYLALVRRWE